MAKKSSANLKRLLRGVPASSEIMRVFADVQLMPDYPAVMIASSLMDAGLRHLLDGYLIEDVPPMVFDEANSILGSFASKITMVYAMGLIGPKTKDVLTVVKDVRNFFAHYTLNASFEMDEIKTECEKIETPRRYKEGPPELLEAMIVLTKRNSHKLNYVHICNFICLEINNHLVLKNNPRYLTEKPIEIY